MKREILSYEDFKTAIREGLLTHLPDRYADYSVCESRIFKVNETVECINVMAPPYLCKDKIIPSPNIYLKKYYAIYLETRDVDKVMDDMADVILSINLPVGIDKSKFDLCEYKDNIVWQLINREKNREYLELLPHKNFLDLAAICRVVVFGDNGVVIGAVITHGMLERMDMSAEELIEHAGKQFRSILKPRTLKIAPFLYTITNDKHYLGAAAIIEAKEIEMLSKKLKSDLYVLPSSIHEVMVVPYEYGDVNDLRALVRNANEVVVEPDEWLSDEVYFYSCEERVLRLVTEDD